MRAAILRAYGAAPELSEHDEPRASGGQVVVDVLAAGLNPVDITTAAGTSPYAASPLASILGREGIGRLPDGSRAYFDASVVPFGSFAERALVAEAALVPLPVALDDGLAVALGIAGLAAWLALDWRARLQPGETVLVLGASGIVGQVALQAARLLGAGRVVAAARDPRGLERAAELGADATVRLDEPADLADELRSATEGGPDVIVDPLWGEPALAALRAAKPHARHVQLGQSAAAELALPSGVVRGRPVSILGHTHFQTPPDVRRAAYLRLVGHAAAGELTAEVERVPLERIAEAWERQRSGAKRKLVIVP